MLDMLVCMTHQTEMVLLYHEGMYHVQPTSSVKTEIRNQLYRTGDLDVGQTDESLREQ